MKMGICGACDGWGVKGKSELVDYHRGETIGWAETCRECNGSGRMMATIVTTIEPFTPVAPTSREDAEREFYKNRYGEPTS